MASLQARSHLRSTHLLLLVNKLLSFAAFALVLCAGWVVLSYIRTEWSPRPNQNSGKKSALAPVEANTQPKGAALLETRRLAAPVKLVYSCAGDRELYHTSAHLPPRAARSAVSEGTALRRGLKPCPICVRE